MGVEEGAQYSSKHALCAANVSTACEPFPGNSSEEPEVFLLTRNMMSVFSVPVYGFMSPPIILFTVVTNSLVCLVLLKQHMRSASNTILVGMALSDTLTGVSPLPCFIFFFALGAYLEYVPYGWCFAFHCLTNYVPTIFHTASIWLTVGLAAHRYVCVCHSLVAKKWCTNANVVKGIVVLYVAAFLSQVTRFVESKYTLVEVPSNLGTGSNVTGCIPEMVGFVNNNLNVYYNLYYFCPFIFIHLVPCTMLIVLNALLIQTMRTAQARRQQLLKQNRKSECRRLAESNLTIMMLVAVVGLFLLVELPMALLFIIMIVDNTFELKVIDQKSNVDAPLWINLFILLSYPVNFF